MLVGPLIKKLRKKLKMTLQQLAGFTNLSVGYLSLIERGRTSPTVANLHKICQALNVTMADLFANLGNGNICIKKEERRILFEEPGSLKYEAVVEGQRFMTSLCMHVLDDKVHEANSHVTDECGVILQGGMVVTVNNVDYSLEEGDSLYIPARSPHSFYKTSADPCVSLWVAPAAIYNLMAIKTISESPIARV